MTETAVPKGKPTYRRRKILIQPGYQLRVAATVLLCIIGYSLLLGFLLFYPLHQQFAASASSEQQFWIARQVLENLGFADLAQARDYISRFMSLKTFKPRDHDQWKARLDQYRKLDLDR